jgi:hypothetical protein
MNRIHELQNYFFAFKHQVTERSRNSTDFRRGNGVDPALGDRRKGTDGLGFFDKKIGREIGVNHYPTKKTVNPKEERA